MAVLGDVVEARARQVGDAAVEVDTNVIGDAVAGGRLSAEAEVPLAVELLLIGGGEVLGARGDSGELRREGDGPLAGRLGEERQHVEVGLQAEAHPRGLGFEVSVVVALAVDEGGKGALAVGGEPVGAAVEGRLLLSVQRGEGFYGEEAAEAVAAEDAGLGAGVGLALGDAAEGGLAEGGAAGEAQVPFSRR